MDRASMGQELQLNWLISKEKTTLHLSRSLFLTLLPQEGIAMCRPGHKGERESLHYVHVPSTLCASFLR